MSSKALIVLGLTWVICLSVVPFPVWGDSYTQDEIIPADTLNAPSSPLAEKYSNPYAEGCLTPEHALELALQYNPDLETFGGSIEARIHEMRQSGRLPNPEVELELENFGGSGEFRGGANAEASVRLRQRMELGGKRQRRMDVARTEVKLEETQRRAYISELHALVRTRTLDLAVAQEQLELARAQAELSHTLLAMVRAH